MPRKLKTFTTSVGFFDLAVSAPSMKAALAAWDAGDNLFQHGFARQTDDPSIVAATMARPGVVLRRPVGTNKAFTEHAEVSALPPTRRKSVQPARKSKRPQPSPPAKPAKPTDGKATRKAVLDFEREQKRRERQSLKEAAALRKERERRVHAIAAAEEALGAAEQAHKRTMQDIERARASLDRKSANEETRWKKEQERLQDGLRRARSPRHLRLV